MLSQFNFNSNELRIAGTSEEPLFCLKDVCAILDISNVPQVAERIPESNICKTYVAFERSTTSLWFVNEPGLYQVIFRSNKPEAEAFRDWVFSEVLPSVRKTGSYSILPPQPKPQALSPDLKLRYVEKIQELGLGDFAELNPKLAQRLIDSLMGDLMSQPLLPGSAPQLCDVTQVALELGYPQGAVSKHKSQLGKTAASWHRLNTGGEPLSEQRCINGKWLSPKVYERSAGLESVVIEFFTQRGVVRV